MMTAMPYNLQGNKGVVEISGRSISQIVSSGAPPKWKNIIEVEGAKISRTSSAATPKTASSIDSEPTSILDTRRSPSPPTSTSTLSSFNGGGNSSLAGAPASGGTTSSDNRAAVAALSDTSHVNYPGERREEWASELQNLHNASGIITGGTAGVVVERCVGGGGEALGLGDLESLFPGGEGSLLPWIMADTDELGLGLKHLLQSANNLGFEGNAASIAAVDHSSGLDSISGEGSIMASTLHPGLGFPGSGFNHDLKIGSISPSCSSEEADRKGNTNGLNPNQFNNLFTPGSNVSVPVLQAHQFDLTDEKPHVYNPQFLLSQQLGQGIQSPGLFLPSLGYCQLEQNHPSKRHNPGVALESTVVQVGKGGPYFDAPGSEFLLRKQQQHQQQQQQQFPIPKHYQLQQHQQLQEQAVRDHLFKAADLILTGNFSHAQEILARLNHQLSLPAKPLIRVALYAKEALQLLLLMSNPVAAPLPKCLTPFDVVHKMNAYKVFSEASPYMQFVNFTSTQAILEAVDDSDTIHIVDFDVGCGAKWASFIQELPLRKRGAPSLKITAIASSLDYHPFELILMHDNLMQFANDVGIALELHILNLESFDPSNSTMPNFRTTENECLAVNFPIWASSNRPYMFPSLLRFIKQQTPKIMISLDRGSDRCDVPFSQHLLHALDSCTNLLESLDGLSIASDVMSKVEKFLIQPAIETAVMGRLHAPDRIPHWKNLFASAGFSPVAFSNFTETQADYVLKRNPGRGFQVEKRQASLVLSWQRRDLVATSAWRC